jgi:hypothetical protein
MEAIRDTGWRRGVGFRGDGVYFWRKTELWEKIGIAWFEFAKREGSYERDEDPGCGIVHVNLETKEDRFLDLEQDQFRDDLIRVCVKHDVDPKSKADVIGAIHDMYLQDYEQQVGTTIAVVRVILAVPNVQEWYPFRFIGNPTAYVVRDETVICITDCTSH